MTIAEPAKRFPDSKSGIFFLCLAFTTAMLYHRVVPLDALPFYQGSAGQDCYQMVWDLWEVNEAITAGHNPFRTGLVYWPLGAQMGRHSLAAGFFPITFIVKLLSGGNPMYPFYAYRIIILLSFTLILYFSYLTLRELNFSRWASAIPSLAYGFSAFYMEHFFHLTQIAGFFIPLTAFCVVRWYHKPNAGRLLMAAAVASCSLYFTEFAIYIFMAALFLGLLMLISAGERKVLLDKLRRTGSSEVVLSIGLASAMAAPFVFSFHTVHTLAPAPSESSYYSANLAGFFIPSTQDAPLYGALFSRFSSGISNGMREPFIGFPILLLTLAALIKSKRKLVWFSALLSFIFFLLSLGPSLKFLDTDSHIPLPYGILMRIPPFDSGRTPVRFVVMGIFFLIIVAANGLAWIQDNLSEHRGLRWATTTMSLILIWTLAERYSPMPRAQSFAQPRGLEKLISGPVLNLPLLRNDGYAEALQIFHRQPIATGYLARYTPEQRQHFEQLQRLFNKGGATFCDGVKAMGYRNVVIAPRGVVPDAPSLVPLELSKCSLNIVDLRTGDLYSRSGAEESEGRPERFPAYTLGKRVDFTSPDSDKFLWYGWSDREPKFRWTNRSRAAIAFTVSEVRPVILMMKIGAFLVPGKLEAQTAGLALNGHQVTTLQIRQSEPKEYSFILPVEFLRNENVLSFSLPDAESPITFHLGEDSRLLGINVEWIEIDPGK